MKEHARNAEKSTLNPIRQRLSQLTEEEIQQLYRDLFNTEKGKIVLEDLKLRGYSYKPSYEEGVSTEFNEGKRSMVLHIQTMIGE